METMTDAQIGKKLANVFKVLYFQNVKNTKMPLFKKMIDEAIKNMENLKAENNELYSGAIAQYEELIGKLNAKYVRIQSKINNTLNNLVKDDAELKNHVGEVL